MKRIMLLALAIGMVAISSLSLAAMSTSKVRKNARFLTDRMVYELNLSPQQYNDIYEINFDFIYNVRYLMDDVVLGNVWALEDYYQVLDIRNDDLRWVLNNSQYVRFLGLEYFSRPIFASTGRWDFRVYIVYPNINYFYFSKPYHYRNYSGNHYRDYYDDRSYYSNRYHHETYNGNHGFRDYNRYFRDDFQVTTRPGTSTRPSNSVSTRPSNRPSRSSGDDIYDNRPNSSGNNNSRPSGNNNTTRPSGSSSTVRPSGTPSPGSSSSARPSGSSSTRPSSSTTTRPSETSSGTSSSRPNSSSSSRTSTSSSSISGRPSSGSSSNRSPDKVNENSNTSRPSSSSKVSERPSSSSTPSSESRNSSGSSGSSRGGRR